MSKLEIHIPHCLSQNQALLRVQMLLSEIKKEHAGKINDLQEKWQDNVGKFSFNTMKLPVAGTLTVQPRVIDLTVTLPPVASSFKDKIESLIRDKIEILLVTE